MPFLRKLQQLPETRRQFEIDNHLSRFVKALKHLHTLGADDEILAYVTRHVLYKEALELYKYQPEQQKEITRLYADYLQDQSKHKDAAIGEFGATVITKSHFTNENQHTNHLLCTMRLTNATNARICGVRLCTVR